MVIDTTYRPPAQLQINQACRRTFEDRYYKSTTFAAAPDYWDTSLLQWGRSLNINVARKVTYVRVEITKVTVGSGRRLRVWEEIQISHRWFSAQKGRGMTRDRKIKRFGDREITRNWLADKEILKAIRR